MNNFLGKLKVEYDDELNDGQHWIVTESFQFHVGSSRGSEYVNIGAGMKTDFASMPYGVRMIFRSPGGRWDKPAVVHDCLYKTGAISHVDGSSRPVTREEADDIFNEAMKVTEVNGLARRLIYRGVRVGGVFAWNKHRKADELKAA